MLKKGGKRKGKGKEGNMSADATPLFRRDKEEGKGRRKKGGGKKDCNSYSASNSDRGIAGGGGRILTGRKERKELFCFPSNSRLEMKEDHSGREKEKEEKAFSRRGHSRK